MNDSKVLKDRLKRLMQRLDHSVPDNSLSKVENLLAAAELNSISARLYALMPDPSLSPHERIERLARVIEEVPPKLEYLQSAKAKVDSLIDHLNELIPGDLTPEQKIDKLVEILNEHVPNDVSIVTKLEALGDPRVLASSNLGLAPNPELLSN